MTLRENLDRIHQGFKAGLDHLGKLERAMAALEEAGMYPAVPTEQWQSRNGGEPIYLYMMFHFDHRQGGYTGPDGKQKVYVGCKEKRIDEARRLARNRRRWEQLQRTRQQLGAWLVDVESEVKRLARRSDAWPQLDKSLWQQLELG